MLKAVHRLTMPMQTDRCTRSLHEYTIVIRPEANGTFVAHIPAIPSCHAWGQTPEAAQIELSFVFDMIQEEYQEVGEPMPSDVELVVAHAS
jgi:predicted RNase H-like HicB family nuclease